MRYLESSDTKIFVKICCKRIPHSLDLCFASNLFSKGFKRFYNGPNGRDLFRSIKIFLKICAGDLRFLGR